mgnify:CR=1 FL=1
MAGFVAANAAARRTDNTTIATVDIFVFVIIMTPFCFLKIDLSCVDAPKWLGPMSTVEVKFRQTDKIKVA